MTSSMIYIVLQYTHMEKCNLFVLYNKNSNGLKDLWGMKKEKQVCWRGFDAICVCPRSRSTTNENAHRSRQGLCSLTSSASKARSISSSQTVDQNSIPCNDTSEISFLIASIDIYVIQKLHIRSQGQHRGAMFMDHVHQIYIF